MLRWFETYIDPYKNSHEIERPPSGLLDFYWHFIAQAWQPFAALLIVGLIAAIIEVSLFAFVGELVDLMRAAENPASFFADHLPTLLFMSFVALILRPLAFGVHTLLTNQTILASFTNMVRWQSHRYLLRQSIEFFQNDFAGRIANKVMQTSNSLRDTVVQLTEALWFVAIYVVSALVLFAQNDVRLLIPISLWIAAYGLLLWYFVPRIKTRAKAAADARSVLTGRFVDTYTNQATVKLFAHSAIEDDYARSAIDDHQRILLDEMRYITGMEASTVFLNGFLIVGTAALALWLWSLSAITLGAIALTTGLVIRINNMSQWIMWVITGVFENIGTVQDGIETLTKAHLVTDRKDARALQVTDGAIHFETISFHYGKDKDAGQKGVIEDLSLAVKPGEKVGLVGRSGAGKSTLVNLLLRFYDLERGAITIDGQDIAKVTQDSLRRHIGMVTQDTSLLHRSVMDNIRYGNDGANVDEAIAAAKLAQAHEFILGLEDQKGRKGYDAHVGERGVKLSGGQRQRIAVARVLLKDAPILVLDEATSALDSEIEAALQEQFYNLMHGKTVIAIAHRLSTIAAMDRLIVMDDGRIVEDGTHDELVAKGGIYAGLWSRQSGGFLAFQPESAAAE